MERNKVLQYNELNLRHKIREVLKPVVSFTLSKFKVKIKKIKGNVKLQFKVCLNFYLLSNKTYTFVYL